MQAQAVSGLRVSSPMVDIVPEQAFMRMSGGRDFKSCGLTPAVIPTANGVITGLLVHATEVNAPMGCFRCVQEDVLSIVWPPLPHVDAVLYFIASVPAATSMQ